MNVFDTTKKNYQIIFNQNQYVIKFDNDNQYTYLQFNQSDIRPHPSDPDLYYIGNICLNYRLFTNFVATAPNPPNSRNEVLDILNSYPQLSRDKGFTTCTFGQTSSVNPAPVAAIRVLFGGNFTTSRYISLQYMSVATTCTTPVRVRIIFAANASGGVWTQSGFISELNDLAGFTYTNGFFPIAEFVVKDSGYFPLNTVSFPMLFLGDPISPYVVEVDQQGQVGNTQVTIGWIENPTSIN